MERRELRRTKRLAQQIANADANRNRIAAAKYALLAMGYSEQEAYNLARGVEPKRAVRFGFGGVLNGLRSGKVSRFGGTCQ